MKGRYILHNNFNKEIIGYHKQLVLEVAALFNLPKTKLQNIPAHFTLKYWFEADEEELAALEEVLNIFASHHSSSLVTYGDVNGFPPNVAFIDIELSAAAKDSFFSLIQSLRTLPWITWNDYDAENLHHHSTVAEDCGNTYEDVIRYLQDQHHQRFFASFDNVTISKQVGLIGKLPLVETYRIFQMNLHNQMQE